MNRSQFAIVSLAMLVFAALLPCAAQGADEVSFTWSGADVGGAPVKVPAEGKATVLLFMIPGQPQSSEAIDTLLASLTPDEKVQLIAIISGTEAPGAARQLVDSRKITWPVVADPGHDVSGKFSVHAWPTTVILSPSGELVEHLPGVPKSYAKQVSAYVAFAAGKLDKAGLTAALGNRDTIADSAAQMADRHLQVAQRLLQKGLSTQARRELEQGLKLQPDNPALQAAIIDLMISTNDLAAANSMLAHLEQVQAAGPRIKLLHGKLLMAKGKWDEARDLLQKAVTLNPDPAEAYYNLGLVYEHDKDFGHAAEAFRRAYEHTPAGRSMLPVPTPTDKP